MSPLARLLDLGIIGYQRARADRPSPCRHIPSCSVYGREALARHGAVKGSWYTTRRILRCNPWGTSGFDPVPGSDPIHLDESAPVVVSSSTESPSRQA